MALGKRKRSFGRRRRPYGKRRRLFKRRGRRSSPRTVFLKSIPDRLFCTLKYNDRITLNQASTGQIAFHGFRLNSLHDPDYTGVGHQPLYYDQLVNSLEGNGLYHKYRVHACSWSLRIVNSDSNTEHSICVVPITHGNAISAAQDFDAICEAPYAQRRTLSVNSSGANQAVIKGSCKIKKLEGISSLNYSGNYTAVYGSNPVFDPKLYITSIPMNESTTTGAIYVDVTLYYKCELSDRIYRAATN